VGASRRVDSPFAMDGQPCTWAGVGASNEARNQSRAAGWKMESGCVIRGPKSNVTAKRRLPRTPCDHALCQRSLPRPALLTPCCQDIGAGGGAMHSAPSWSAEFTYGDTGRPTQGGTTSASRGAQVSRGMTSRESQVP